MRQRSMRRVALTVAAVAGALVIAERATAQTTVRRIAAPAAPVTRRVVVSLPDRRLAVLVNGQIVRVFAVAVGAPQSPSPVGQFTIVNRLSDPTYYRPGKVIGPGPSNPLGTRWLGLDIKGYGIHGTDDPASIGYARSHGCIRLRNRDVEELFELLQTGDIVELQGERTAEIAEIFDQDDSSHRRRAANDTDAARLPSTPDDRR